MTVSENIVVGETILHHADRILEGIRLRKPSKYVIWYGITTAAEKENLLYILSGTEMLHQFYYDRELKLIGLAGSRKEAGEIVLNLVQQGYNKGNIHDMKQYLESI